MVDSIFKPDHKFCSDFPDIFWVPRKATATQNPILMGKDSKQYVADQ